MDNQEAIAKVDEDGIRGTEVIKALVNEIYADFKTRTCENCCELQPEFNNSCASGISIPEDFDGFTDLGFGCNEFCRKDK